LNAVLDDRYGDLAAEFQRAQVSALRRALLKYGIERDLAKKICGEFSFDLAMMFDQGEFDFDGDSYRPCVAFTADEEVFYVQPANIEYHEYAFGTTAEVFESDK